MTLRILVADKGPMAVRVAKTLRDNEMTPLGVYTSEDRDSPHRRLFKEDGEVSDYNNPREILSVANELGADGIHPGCSILAGDPEFAREVVRRGMVYIGPSPDIIALLRDKIAIRVYAEKLDVPVIPWLEVRKPDDIVEFAKTHGYPLVFKPVRGFGVTGLGIVRREIDINKEMATARKISEKLFNEQRLVVEPIPVDAKYIEIQVLGDGDNVVHLYDRECLIDNRFSKLAEEAPSPSLTQNDRDRLFEYVIRLAKGLRVDNSTVFEFLFVPSKKEFYFVDANPGLTLEHTVTEMITRRDIVKKQVEIAFYSALDTRQKDVIAEGHAIGVKVLNVDPLMNNPLKGRVEHYIEPNGHGVRVESILDDGWFSRGQDTELISKLTVWAYDRNTCLGRIRRALSEYVIEGITTNIPLLQLITATQWFTSGSYSIITLIDEYKSMIEKLEDSTKTHAIALSAIFEIDDKRLSKYSKKQRSLENVLRSERVSSVKRHAWYYYVSLKSALERRHSRTRSGKEMKSH